VWAQQIPPGIRTSLLETYHQTLVKFYEPAANTRRFNEALMAGCAGWFAAICTVIPHVMQQDKKWGRSTGRQRVMAAIQHFIAISNELKIFPALRHTVQMLYHYLRDQWPDEDCHLGTFPAFVSS
jgi:hypothetical protein